MAPRRTRYRARNGVRHADVISRTSLSFERHGARRVPDHRAPACAGPLPARRRATGTGPARVARAAVAHRDGAPAAAAARAGRPRGAARHPLARGRHALALLGPAQPGRGAHLARRPHRAAVRRRRRAGDRSRRRADRHRERRRRRDTARARSASCSTPTTRVTATRPRRPGDRRARVRAYRLHRVYGCVEPRNTASVRVLERLGMRREAHLIENEWGKGEWHSEAVYAILAREWRAARERL